MKYDVNLDLANATKKQMYEHLNTGNPRVLNKPSFFASLYSLDLSGYDSPVLVMKTEEPGSKQLLAMEHGRIEGVCFDMINHLINDCIVSGARPLLVQDAIICGKLDQEIVSKIVKAISMACVAQDCLLTGGETSEQPGVLPVGTYILCSSVVGVVEKAAIIDGTRISNGDSVICLPSNGAHTNGYTFIRKLMKEYPGIKEQKIGDETFLDAILMPHKCYYRSLRQFFGGEAVMGLAHITGGGIRENLDRILPSTLDAEIDLSKYVIPELFKVMHAATLAGDDEMLRTFNLGVGMVAIVKRQEKDSVLDGLRCEGVNAYEIGQIVNGSGKVVCKNSLMWN